MNIDWHSTELTRMTVVDESDKMPKTCAAFWLHSAESVSGSIRILRPGYAMRFPKTWERWWMSGSAERLADTHICSSPILSAFASVQASFTSAPGAST